MNRYTRINDLLGRHASKSFHTDKTIHKYLNRKTKYRNKIIKNHQHNHKNIENELISVSQEQGLYCSNNETDNGTDYEFNNETDYESDTDSQNTFYIDELENELNDELVSKSIEIEFKPLDREYEELYVFDRNDLEVRLHYLSAKYATNMKQFQIIKQYLKLEKDFMNGRLNSDDIKKIEISKTIQYHLINFPNTPLYTKEDYINLKNELNEYQKIIERYQKSIQILNNNNNIDEIVEDNNIHLYNELINIFS
jgi:hypothetical protein